MFGLGWQEFLIVLVIVLVLFGGKKIPELLRGVGRGVGELQKGLDEGKRTFERSMREEESAAPLTASSDPNERERALREREAALRQRELEAGEPISSESNRADKSA
jgi:sec-independent protein translocase protein TatA